MVYLWLFLISIVIFHILTRYNKRGRILGNIPGYTPYPIFGNILRFTFLSQTGIYEAAREMSKKFYPINRVWFLKDALINVMHPDDLEIILTSQKVIDKGYIYDYLHPWLKTGLLTSTRKKWHQRRKLLTPAFYFGILKKYFDITDEQGNTFIKELKSEGKESSQNLIPLCTKVTLNIICESAMGVSLDNMNPKEVDEYKSSVHLAGCFVCYRMVRPYLAYWMIPYVSEIGRKYQSALKVLHQFTSKIVSERREYHRLTKNKYLEEIDNSNENNLNNESDIGQKRRLVMLDLLLTAERKGLIDNEGIMEEVDTFTFEGHDTTGMAMLFTLLLLANNKDAQDRARAEVTEIFNKSNGKVENFQECDYLDRCIKESLRLYPPVSTLLRYTEEDLQLKHAFVPAKTHLMIHLYDTHRDPHFWSDPEKFDPDRFLPENTKNRHPFAYVPFSAGPRNCIGQKFAMMELKSLVAKILYNFYLEPIDRIADVKLIADIVIRPHKPVYVKFIKINK